MTGRLFEVIQKYSYFVQGDKRYFYYDLLSKNLKISKDEIIAVQNHYIKKIISHCYDSVPYYKNLFNRMDIDPSSIKTRDDLKKIPVLTKSIIRKEFNSLKSTDEHGQKLKLVTSGGSTGNQTIISVSPYYEQMGRASTLRTNALIGWLPSDKSLWIWGAPYENQNLEKSLKAKLGIFINRRKVINAYRYKE